MFRGEYRPLFCVLTDDPDFQRLSRDAKLLFFILKLELGASGIGVVYDPVLVQKSGIPFEGVRDAMNELHAGDWTRRQETVLWIRNGLRFEPNLSLENENHRKSVVRHLQGLPKLEIVNAYAVYYDLDPPFPDLPNAIPSEGDPQGVLDGMGDQESGERRTENGSRVEANASMSTDAVDGGEDDEDPVPWMHEIWHEEFGIEGHRIKLTAKRRQKYRALYDEQLADAKKPRVAYRSILRCVQQSDHHMSKRSYQMPDSLFVNEERRERWVQDTIDWLQNGRPGSGDREVKRRGEETLAYLRSGRGG